MYDILFHEEPLSWPREAGKENQMALRASKHIKRPGPLPETFTPFFLVGVKVFFCAPCDSPCQLEGRLA